MPRLLRVFFVFVFGLACSFGGWAVANASGSAVLKPKAGEAILIPAQPDPPGNCDETRAGWIYMDTEVGNASYPCVCVRNNQKVWDWVVLGASGGKLCE